MAMTIDLDPVLDKLVEQEAKRQGISKSEFVSNALEQVLSLKSPAEIYRRIIDKEAYRVAEPTTNFSENSGEKFKALLREKHSA